MNAHLPGHAACLLLITVLCPCRAWAGDIHALQVEHHSGVYRLSMDVTMDAGYPAVYALVTDFDGSERLSPSITDSHTEGIPDDGRIKRHITVNTCVWFFCFEVRQAEWIALLDNTVTAEVIPEESNMGPGRSVWEFTALPEGRTRLQYQTEQQPEFWIPPVIGPWLLKKKFETEVIAIISRIEILARGGEGQQAMPAYP